MANRSAGGFTAKRPRWPAMRVVDIGHPLVWKAGRDAASQPDNRPMVAEGDHIVHISLQNVVAGPAPLSRRGAGVARGFIRPVPRLIRAAYGSTAQALVACCPAMLARTSSMSTSRALAIRSSSTDSEIAPGWAYRITLSRMIIRVG